MAFQRSTDQYIYNDKNDNAEIGGSGIELSQTAGNIYDSLECKDRDSHIYVTANETSAKASSDTTNVKNKGHSNGTATSSSLKVEVPCWAICAAAIGVLLLCTLICTISGGIVYQVINSKITEIERQPSHSKDTTSSANITEALVVAINVFKAEVSQLNNVWKEQFSSLSNNQSASREYQMAMNRRLEIIDNVIEAFQEKQNLSDVTSLEYKMDMNRRLEIYDNVIEAFQEKQNLSDVASLEYKMDMNRRLEIYDNAIEAFQEKQNLSDVASLEYKMDMNRRLEIYDNAIEAFQEKQNLSDVASLEYKMDMNRRLEIIDNVIEAFQEKQNLSDVASLEYKMDMNRRLEIFDNVIEAFQEKQNLSDVASLEYKMDMNRRLQIYDNAIEAFQETQNLSDVASLEYKMDMNRRLEIYDNAIEAFQEKQNLSDVASLEYKMDMNRRLEIYDNVVEVLQEKQNSFYTASRENHTDIYQRLGTINNLIQAVKEKQNVAAQQVVFTVTTSTGTLVDGAPIFRHIVLNKGGAYNTSTGRFTCPVQGVYLFTLTLVGAYTRTSSVYFYCGIYPNTAAEPAVTEAWSEEGSRDSASITTFLHLSVGDVVFLRCYNWQNVGRHSYATLYSGSLIKAD